MLPTVDSPWSSETFVSSPGHGEIQDHSSPVPGHYASLEKGQCFVTAVARALCCKLIESEIACCPTSGLSHIVERIMMCLGGRGAGQ
jgi:hypothetical protein